ncbi:ESPR-type extended signal peptide-containing protein, partial [Variovorax sp. M-6]|uniref:ESPR domain-containing protein n=1 Tax=Variovorax sp. M-6 TaxID=3233041 RepID=UPI003F977A1C
MNKVYRVIWNKATGTWTAASEAARGKGKGSGKALAGALLLVGFGVLGTHAHAGYVAGGGTAGGDGNSIGIGCADATAGGAVALGGDCSNSGPRTKAQGGISVAVGYDANVLGTTSQGSIALGAGSQIGTSSSGGAANAAAVGRNAKVGDGATGALALGSYSTVAKDAVNAVATGTNASASAANSVALGASAVANRGAVSGVANALSYSGAKVTTTTGEISVGSATAQRQITNVAAGTQDTDAVNVGQVKTVKTVADSNAAAVASALGGGSAVKADGTISAPSYTVGGTTVNNVGAAVTNLDGRTTTNATNIATNTNNISNLTNNLNSGSVGLVKQDATTKAITVAGDKAGTSVNFAGTDGARTLSGVKAATLAAGSTEAVNGGQLFTTNQNVAANTANIATNTTNIAGNTTAIAKLDGRVTTVEGSVSELTNNMNSGSVGLVKQDATTKAITVAGDKAGTSVDFTGTAGARTLSGVKDGTLGETSREAVN